eukprot:1141985-Pelagomonas_calceolata.AAC.1
MMTGVAKRVSAEHTRTYMSSGKNVKSAHHSYNQKTNKQKESRRGTFQAVAILGLAAHAVPFFCTIVHCNASSRDMTSSLRSSRTAVLVGE